MAAVRKRIVIGLLSLSVIGAAVFFFSQPRKGTVEWHKKQYVDARMRLWDKTLRDRMVRMVRVVTGKKDFGRRAEREYDSMISNEVTQEAILLEKGFLARRLVTVDFTNVNAVHYYMAQSADAIDGYANGHFKGTDDGWCFEVTAPPNDLPKWEELIRKGAFPRAPAE